MKKRKGILWFRQDLRIHDNEALVEALKNCQIILPVFIFDERLFKGKTNLGFPKTGNIRAQFIIESVANLKKSLQLLGTDLIIRVGKPEEEIFQIAQAQKTSWIFCNRERTKEEMDVQDTLEANLWSIGQEIRYSRGKMLYYTADLPFPITHIPDAFSHFRKEVERFVTVRPPLPTPNKILPFSSDINVEKIPEITDFGFKKQPNHPHAVLNFKGGEHPALQRLHSYFWKKNLPKTLKKTRDEMIGGNYSTKFSAWLAQGCLSPKKVFEELQKYENIVIKNKSTYSIFLDLMWRDYFRFMAKKHGNAIFQKAGIRGKEKHDLKDDKNLFQIWKEGRTGIPFIDASMRELAQTGFISNRGRKNVANFLINDLKVNWLWGAEYFESQLIDYDPASNYCNWNYHAEVDNDPREDRYFNILSQAKKYDSQGTFVRRWIPELANLPNDRIHRPDLLTQKEQEEYGVKIGLNYPRAMINISKWD